MLTRKALLNGFQLIVDQMARMLVNFLLTPLLVTYLGSAGFGVWQIIQKVSIQIAALDGRAPEVLKWVIAGSQKNDNVIKKQEFFGSAVISFIVFSPLLLSVYVLAVIFMPVYLELDVNKALEVQYVIILLGIGSFLLVIANLFEASIRGMNLAYKLLGVQALVLLVGGGISAYAVVYGYGLKGLAFSQIVIALLFLLSYFYVARKHISWLGVSMPSRSEIISSLNRSKWYTSWAFVSAWLFTGDIIVLGFIVEAELVSQYVLTMFLAQIITVAILTAVASVLPGLAGIIGGGENVRAEELRQESFLYSWWLSLTICSVIIILNESFVSLWVGSEFYAGDNINTLIVICVMQLVFIRHDANILNLALDVRKKVILGFVSALFSLLLMLLLVPEYHIIGLCVALLAGRLVLQLTYPRIINKFLAVEAKAVIKFRRIGITIAMLCASWFLSAYIYTDSWWILACISGLLFVLVMFIIYFLGIDAKQKSVISRRVKLLGAINK